MHGKDQTAAEWAPRRLRTTALLLPTPAYPRDGRFIEEIGTYDPEGGVRHHRRRREALKKWIKNGAQPTDTVRGLLKKANVL